MLQSSCEVGMITTNERSEDLLAEENNVRFAADIHSRRELERVGESEEAVPVKASIVFSEEQPKRLGMFPSISKIDSIVTQNNRNNRTVEEGTS